MATITDDFNRANSDTLGTLSDSSGSWSEVAGDHDIASNKLISGTAGANFSRADVDFSSDAHYAEVELSSWTGTQLGQAAGVCTRYASGADTCYYFYVRRDSLNYRFYKRVAGVNTQIGSTVSEAIPSLPITIKLSSDGSDEHICSINGVAKITATDSSITGNLRAGVVTGRVSSDITSLDDFEAGDLSSGPVISYFSAVTGVSNTSQGLSARSVAVQAISGAASSVLAQKSIAIGLSAIAGAVGSAAGTKSASAGISAIAGLLSQMESTAPGTSNFNAIAGALVAVTHSTARLSTIEGKVGSRGAVAGLRRAISSLQAISGAVAAIEGPPDDNRVSSFAAIAGAAAALSKTTARIADLAARAGLLGANTAATIRAAQIAAVAGLRAAIAGFNVETAGTLLTVSVAARAAYECAASARAAYNCTISEAIVQ